MGMKSKVRSMQRGAQKRSTEPQITNADLYRQSPPLLTDDELAHFKFGNRSINDFFVSGGYAPLSFRLRGVAMG
jgi:hypothetical protein